MPPPDSHQSLTAGLKSLLEENAITTAVIVDDAARVMIRDDVWIELRDVLESEDEETWGKVVALLNDKGIEPEQVAPPEEYHGEIRTLVTSSQSESVKQLLAKRRFGESAIDSLSALLASFGLDVTPCESPDTAPVDKGLYFVDYDINDTQGNSGQRAQVFLSRLAEEQKAAGTIPAVVLMSRFPRQHAGVSQIANNAHIVRFCFRFREKEHLVASAEHLSFHLLELLETFPLAKKYLQHVDALRESLLSAANSVTNDLLRLTPADFCMFASQKLGGAGRDSIRHLHFLFNGLLESSLNASSAVQESFEAFSNTLAESPIRVMTLEGLALHELHAKILYDNTSYTLQRPLTFGDILSENEEASGLLLLVLTPECDLEVRHDGRPNAERILLLEGKRTNSRSGKDFLEYSPLLGVSDGRAVQWIEWNLRRPMAIERDTLFRAIEKSGGVYRRWGRMRHEFAERLQQRFTADILEVGTEEILSGFSQRKTAVFGGQNGREKLSDVTLCEMQIGDKDILWALGENAASLIDAIGENGSMAQKLKVFRYFAQKMR